MKKMIALAALVFSALLVQAQTTIKPGDKTIRYDWIQPSHEYYRCVVTDTSGKVTYDFMMDNYITIDPVNKHITFARSRQVPAGSFSTDTSVTDQFFKPIRMHEIHYQRDVVFDMRFGDTQATVTTTRKGVASVKNYPMKSGYFEDNMIEYIFSYLELKKGVTYTLDDFNKDAPSPSDPYVLEYAFDDVWNMAGGHNIYCTVLHFTHGDVSGYIWTDNSTHKAIKVIGSFKGGRYLITKI